MSKEGLMSEHIADNEDEEAVVDTGVEASNEPSDTQGDDYTPLKFDERPEYIAEQFWNEDEGTVNLEALAKSQKDFRAKASKKEETVASPESIEEYVLSEDIGIADDDPVLQATKESALKHGVPVEAFEAFVKDFAEATKASEEQATYNAEAEKAKLGANADKVIANLATNLDKMVSIGLFGEQDYEAAVEVASTAEGVKMLNKIFNHYQQVSTIPTDTAIPDSTPSLSDIQDMVGTDEYNNNPAFRAKVKAGFEAHYGKD